MVDPGRDSGLQRIVRALHHRNYRLFFGGQSISLVGTWMQRIAMSWLVYRLTDSPFLLGFVGFAGQLPIFLVTPFAGVLADRFSRHRMLIVTQTLAMFQALTLAILVLTGAIAVWHIVLLSIFLGFVDAFDLPIRQSFVVEMIERKEDLGNAIALNSSMVNSARLLGPSVAGILIASVGEGICFLLNGISYLAVIASLVAMRIKPRPLEERRTNLLGGLREGASYAFHFVPIRSVLLLITLVSLMGMPHTVLMPVFARDMLHGDSHTLGFLLGASGMGSLVGAFYLAGRKGVAGLEKWSGLAAGIFGMGLIPFAFSRSYELSLFLMLVAGFGMIVQFASSNTVLQTIVEEDKRGRVMSLYAMAFRGMTPFGSLLAGTLASAVGAPNTLMIGGVSCVLGSIFYARNLRKWHSFSLQEIQ
jgi:MFS family permease